MDIAIAIFYLSLFFGQLTVIQLLPYVFVYLHEFVLLFFIIDYLMRRMREKKFLVDPLVVSILLFGFVGFVSLLANVQKFTVPQLMTGSFYLWRWLAYSFLYVIVRDDGLRVWRWIVGLYAYAVALAVAGLVQFFLYPDLRNLYYLGWDPHYYRVFSTLLDPNFTGLVLGLAFLLGIHVWHAKKYQGLSAVAQCIILVALVLTFSRSSYVSFFIGITGYLIIRRKWNVLLVMLMASCVIIFIPRSGREGWNLFRSVSSHARVQNWQQSIGLFVSSPVIGHGFNTLQFLPDKIGIKNSTIISRTGSGVDNSFLFLLAATGIIGFVSYVTLLVKQIRLGFAGIQHNSLHFIVLLSILMIIIHSLFSNSLFYPWVMLWIWILTGVLASRTILH